MVPWSLDRSAVRVLGVRMLLIKQMLSTCLRNYLQTWNLSFFVKPFVCQQFIGRICVNLCRSLSIGEEWIYRAGVEFKCSTQESFCETISLCLPISSFCILIRFKRLVTVHCLHFVMLVWFIHIATLYIQDQSIITRY